MSFITKNEDLTSSDLGSHVGQDLGSSHNVVYVAALAESDTVEIRINAVVRRLTAFCFDLSTPKS